MQMVHSDWLRAVQFFRNTVLKKEYSANFLIFEIFLIFLFFKFLNFLNF
jgi:hypothetical protein